MILTVIDTNTTIVERTLRKKQQQNQEREQPTLPDIFPHQVDRIVNIFGFVIDLIQLQVAVGEHTIVQFGHRGLEATHHLQDIRSCTTNHIDGDDFAPNRCTKLVAFLCPIFTVATSRT